jgi:hypothetical protein
LRLLGGEEVWGLSQEGIERVLQLGGALMMHPIDLRPIDDEQATPTPGGGSVWWAVIALVIVVALLVTAVIAFSNDDAGENPVEPPPTEAPLDPGA